MTYYLLTAVSFDGHSAASSLLFFSVFYYVVRFLANNYLSHFLVVLTTLNDLE